MGVDSIVGRILLVVKVGKHVHHKFSEVAEHDLKDRWLTLHHCIVLLEESFEPIREHKVIVVCRGGFPGADALLHLLERGGEVEGGCSVGGGEAILVGGGGGRALSRRGT